MAVTVGVLRRDVDKWELSAAALFVATMTVLSVLVLAKVPFPFRGADEQGHLSYVIHLANADRWWPDLAAMPLYDRTGAPLAGANFINHPPLFYWLSLPVYEAATALRADLSWMRAFSLALSVGAFMTLGGFGVRMQFGILGFVALLAGMVFLDVPTFAGSFNNDQMAALGGAAACLGAARRISPGNDRSGLPLVLAGVVLCSVKLTAFLLVGAFAAFALAGAPKPRADLRGLAALGLTGAVAATPYLVLWAVYGSPAPNTPGQEFMLKAYIAEFGWQNVPKVDALEYLTNVPSLFAVQLGKSALPLLVLAAMFGALFVGFMPSARKDRPVAAALVRAAFAATLVVLCIHIAFAYRRYVAYGWLGDLYPRYYFPLLGAYGLGWALCVRRAVAVVEL